MRRNDLTEFFAPHWVTAIVGAVSTAASLYGSSKAKQAGAMKAAGDAQPQGGSAGSFTPTATAMIKERGGASPLPIGAAGATPPTPEPIGAAGPVTPPLSPVSAGAPPTQGDLAPIPTGRGLGDIMKQDQPRVLAPEQAPNPTAVKSESQKSEKGMGSSQWAALANTGAGLAATLAGGDAPNPIAPAHPGSMNFNSSLEQLRRRRGQR